MSETAKRIWAARGMYTVQPDNRWPSPEPYIRLDLHEAEVAKLRAERDALRAALEEIADGLKGIARDIQIGPDDEGREIYDMVQALQWDASQALKGHNQ